MSPFEELNRGNLLRLPTNFRPGSLETLGGQNRNSPRRPAHRALAEGLPDSLDLPQRTPEVPIMYPRIWFCALVPSSRFCR